MLSLNSNLVKRLASVPPSYRDRALFVTILGIGLALRIIYFSWDGWNPERDYVTYHKIIENIVNGDKSALSHVVIPPFYFMVVAAVGRLGVPILHAAVFTSIFAGGILIVTTFFLAQKLFNRKLFSFMLMLFVAMVPELVFISCSPLRDSLGLTLNVLCLTLLLYGLCSGKLLFFCAAGLCTGIGAMVRTENVESCFLMALCMFFMFCERFRNREGRWSFGRIFGAGFLFGGGAIILYVVLSLYAETFGYNWRPQFGRYWVF